MRWLPMLAVLPTLLAVARADEFRLTNGRVVRGEVLKETDDKFFVDIGFTVLDVPKASVTERVEDAAADAARAAEQGEAHSFGLYARANLPDLDVKSAAEKVGEGVVMVKVPGALGSGFIIREDGYIITNAHVVQGEADVSVVVYVKKEGQIEKQTYDDVKIIAVNPFIDLALLKIDEKELAGRKLQRVFFGKIDDIRVGQTVFCVGSPHGLERTVTSGSVSVTNRSMGGRCYVQIDAPINPGNSGGPLFNTKGEVIGVNSLKAGGSEGLNFSIPIDYVEHFIANREAFAYDRDNPNSGYRYLAPPKRPKPETKEPEN